MTIYCDESGGIGAGVILMASLSLPDDVADAAMARVRAVLGLRGELKGSRISMAERAFVVEMLAGLGCEAFVVTARLADVVPTPRDHALPVDTLVYAALLNHVADHWMLRSGGCVTLSIDDGRYDARINALLRDDVQAALGQWGTVALDDSRRVAGVQFADVIANSHFHMAVASSNAKRVEALFDPLWRSGQVKTAQLTGPV